MCVYDKLVLMSKIPLTLSVKKKSNDRSCDGCTKCCEGWLVADIHGETMYPGKPCQYVEQGVGCTIYKNRPKEPCKNFACMWKAVEDVPLEFKPSEIGAIIHRMEIDGIAYLNVVECGQLLNPKLLSWFVTYCMSKRINAHWTADGKAFWMGTDEFNKMMMNRYFN